MASTSRPQSIAYSAPSAPSSPQISTRPRGVSFSGPTFKAPAHKHAHHLHSIPPRQKSTRTLILDHLLWVHAQTRLQQARAELGMSVNKSAILDATSSPESTSGSSADMDVGRESLAAATDDQDLLSDGEDVFKVKFGAKESERNKRSPVEDEYEAMKSLPLAHILRLRADGVEKVLIAMLDQPPEIQPQYSDEDAPRPPPSIHGVGELYFPNGVRLRLALSTLVNDLFARDTPTHLSPGSSNTPAFQARNSQTPSTTPQVAPVQGANKVAPLALLPPASPDSRLKRRDDFLKNGLPSCLLPLASTASFSINANRHASSQYSSSRRASGRILGLYETGIDPLTTNSPPSLRCPRHLHHTCSICAQAQAQAQALSPLSFSNPGAGGSPYTQYASPRSPTLTRGAIVLGSNGKMCVAGDGMGATGLAPWKTGAGIGAGLMGPGIEGTVLRRRTLTMHATPSSRESSLCASGGQLAELLPRFLRLSALVAVELGREAREREEEALRTSTGTQDKPNSYASTFSGDAYGRDGRDLRDEDEKDDDGGGQGESSSGGGSGIREDSGRVSALKITSLSPYLFNLSFRPTREWYAILAGLLTHAALEGYLCREWKGPLGVECLLGVGLGPGPHLPGVPEPEEDEFIHLDPDDCPSLTDAAKILFPCLYRNIRVTEGPEAAYEAEMLERLSEFLSIPPSTDLSTHLEDLAWKFPMEPVERVVVRFCEAVASWRGLPELATYKRAPPVQSSQQSQAQLYGSTITPTPMSMSVLAPTSDSDYGNVGAAGPGQMSIDIQDKNSMSGPLSFTAMNAQTRPGGEERGRALTSANFQRRNNRPAIEKYFVKASSNPLPFGTMIAGQKRRRSPSGSSASVRSPDSLRHNASGGVESRSSRRPHFETDTRQGEGVGVSVDEWTGPYGL